MIPSFWGAKYNWGCPLGLSPFDEFQVQHLAHSILPELAGIRSCLIESGVNWSHFYGWCSIIGWAPLSHSRSPSHMGSNSYSIKISSVLWCSKSSNIFTLTYQLTFAWFLASSTRLCRNISASWFAASFSWMALIAISVGKIGCCASRHCTRFRFRRTFFAQFHLKTLSICAWNAFLRQPGSWIFSGDIAIRKHTRVRDSPFHSD